MPYPPTGGQETILSHLDKAISGQQGLCAILGLQGIPLFLSWNPPLPI
jgi:hypothetical protein